MVLKAFKATLKQRQPEASTATPVLQVQTEPKAFENFAATLQKRARGIMSAAMPVLQMCPGVKAVRQCFKGSRQRLGWPKACLHTHPAAIPSWFQRLAGSSGAVKSKEKKKTCRKQNLALHFHASHCTSSHCIPATCAQAPLHVLTLTSHHILCIAATSAQLPCASPQRQAGP